MLTPSHLPRPSRGRRLGCNHCGVVNEQLGGDAVFWCPLCGVEEPRDPKAAKGILIRTLILALAPSLQNCKARTVTRAEAEALQHQPWTVPAGPPGGHVGGAPNAATSPANKRRRVATPMPGQADQAAWVAMPMPSEAAQAAARAAAESLSTDFLHWARNSHNSVTARLFPPHQ